jgi:hypothetical protein
VAQAREEKKKDNNKKKEANTSTLLLRPRAHGAATYHHRAKGKGECGVECVKGRRRRLAKNCHPEEIPPLLAAGNATEISTSQPRFGRSGILYIVRSFRN